MAAVLLSAAKWYKGFVWFQKKWKKFQKETPRFCSDTMIKWKRRDND